MKYLLFTLAFICALSIPARADQVDEKRLSIQEMKQSALLGLYQMDPATKRLVGKSYGYAVFATGDVAAGVLSGSYGRGIAHNNHNGDETYMQMGSVGVGLGLGVRDFRAIFVFETRDAFRNFTLSGMDLSGQVNVAMKTKEGGTVLSESHHVLPGVRAYVLTERGLLAQAMLKGTKYWGDNVLNAYNDSVASGGAL